MNYSFNRYVFYTLAYFSCCDAVASACPPSVGGACGGGDGGGIAIVNGICGSANMQTLYSPPNSDALCVSGSPSSLSGNGPWTWSCAGSNGGSSQSCSANLTASNSYTYHWNAGDWGVCSASCGGGVQSRNVSCVRNDNANATDDQCLANDAKPAIEQSCNTQSCTTPVNGQCGAANGQKFISAPVNNLCNSGTMINFSGSGPWQWSCQGISGGSTDNCTANLTEDTSTDLSFTPTSESLSAFTYADACKVGDTTYLVASIVTNRDNFFTDPDGTRSSESDVFVIELSNKGVGRKAKIGKAHFNADIPMAAISCSSDKLRVFWNTKDTDTTQYGMNGYLKMVLTSNLTVNEEITKFLNSNWGWYPWFSSIDGLHHFSYAGYFRMIENANIETIQPSTAITEWNNQRQSHSEGILPADNSAVVNKLCNTYCQYSSGSTDVVIPNAWLKEYMYKDGSFFYSALPSEQKLIESGQLGSGWSITGGQFKVWLGSTAPNGAYSVCRFRGDGITVPGFGHFYTALPSECNEVRGGRVPYWLYDGIGFFVYMQAQSCPNGTHPIYRQYNSSLRNHHYQVSNQLSNQLSQNGWIMEGIPFCVAD